MKRSDQKLVIVYFLTDMILLNLSIMLSLLIKYRFIEFTTRYKTFFILCNAIWLLVVYFANNRIMYWRNRPGIRMITQIRSFIVFVGIISFSLLLLKELNVSRFVVYSSTIIFFMLRIIVSYFIFQVLAQLRFRGKNIRCLLVIGTGRIGKQVYRFVRENRDLGYHIVGFLDDNGQNSPLASMIIGKVEDLKNILEIRRVDEIIIALPLNLEQKIKFILRTADFYGVRIKLVPDFYQLINRSYCDGYLGELPTVNIREVPLDDFVNSLLKRGFDILFSISIIIITFPVFLLTSILILLESRGPLLYTPIRIGKDGKKFKLYKFRTMYRNDDDENGTKSTVQDDPRITKVGKFLRRYSIDELPQFFNVLMGDMSVVGPRPHRIWLNENMQHDIDAYMTRHYLYPGITGWAQINGWRGPTDTHKKKIERTNHDLWYMENWTLGLDIKIILLTIFGSKVHQNSF